MNLNEAYAMNIVTRSVKHTCDGKLLTNVEIEGHSSIISNVIGSKSINKYTYILHTTLQQWWRWWQKWHMWISVTKSHAVAKILIFEMWLFKLSTMTIYYILFLFSLRLKFKFCCCCCLSLVIGHPTMFFSIACFDFIMLAVCSEYDKVTIKYNHFDDDENFSIQF